MWKWAIPLVLALGATGFAWQAPEQAKTESKAAASATDTEANAMLTAYAEAFNKHDAKSLSEFWSPTAVSYDVETGARTSGRDAIRAEMETYFKEHASARLALQLKNVKHVRSDVWILEGESTISNPNADPHRASFTATLAKNEGKWQLDYVQEAPLPTPPTPYDGLKGLEWMVGTWVDDSPGVSVETQVKWSPKKSFLIRSYTVKLEDEEPYQGTQIIGWDPRTKSIRSWTFDADGSFGEGTWSNTGVEWRIRTSETTADGQIVTAMQIITKVDNDNLTVQTVGREVDGEPTPTTEAIKVVRHKSTDASK